VILVDHPRFVSLAAYEAEIAAMTERLVKLPGVVAVYRIGGLRAPGISDIDMVAVFADEAACYSDPCAGLSAKGRYLFVHQLFGAPLSLFRESFRYTFFHDFRLLAGEDVRPPVPMEDEARKTMLRQWALEFLARMLGSIAVEDLYGVTKLRGLLLHGKALLYDLDFLGTEAPVLRGHLERILHWRKTWFGDPPSVEEVRAFLPDFRRDFVTFLDRVLAEHPLFLPRGRKLGRNILVVNGQPAGYACRGLRLPAFPLPDRWVRQFFSLQHRLNTIELHLPFAEGPAPAVIAASFDYRERAQAFNRERLPHFMPLTSSLNLA